MDNQDDNFKGINRFTFNARRVINDAYKIAQDNFYADFLVIHIFYVMLKDNNGIVGDIFARLGIDIDSSMKRIGQEFINNKRVVESSKAYKKTVFSEQLKELINESFVVAFNLNHVYVGTEH